MRFLSLSRSPKFPVLLRLPSLALTKGSDVGCADGRLKLDPLTVTFEILGAAKLDRGFENPNDGNCGEDGRYCCTLCN